MILLLILLLLNSMSLDDAIDRALESINAAEDAGAETSVLVDRMNKVLEQMECDKCIDDIKAELASIIKEAEALRDEAISKKEMNAIFIYSIYVPIASFLVSFFALYVYDRWKVYDDNKFLSMRIKERED